jgi:hypothetical protein
MVSDLLVYKLSKPKHNVPNSKCCLICVMKFLTSIVYMVVLRSVIPMSFLISHASVFTVIITRSSCHKTNRESLRPEEKLLSI